MPAASPHQIAETYLDGNRADARAAIITGQTQQSAVVLAFDVLDVLLAYASDGNDIAHIIDSFRRCMRGY